MFLLKIVAIAFCVASLQSWPVSSLSDKELTEQHKEDVIRASTDSHYTSGKHKDDMHTYLMGDGGTHQIAGALQNILNSARLKGETSKHVLEDLSSLREHLLTDSGGATCDLDLYDQIVAIVRMSEKYFEEDSTRDRMVRMLANRLHDQFTSNCVTRLQSDLRQLHDGQYLKQLDSLATFKAFLAHESVDLIQDRSYPDNSPSLMDKLKLVSNGDQAWSQFLRYAAVELKDNDPDRAEKTKTMPRKERITAQFDFVVNNSCVPLSQSNVFVSLVEKISSLAGEFVLDLFANDGLKRDFQKMERYVAMYKVCMKLKDIDRNELMEKVELHTRENFA